MPSGLDPFVRLKKERLRFNISGEETSQEQQRLTSCKSLFTFDSRSRSRYLLASAGSSAHKKSYSLQRFGALSQSSDSESDSAPLLGKRARDLLVRYPQ